MKIKLIIFDLDGVLVDSRELHYQALNMALAEVNEKYVISRDEQDTKYDGRPTTVKLNMLTEQKGLEPTYHDQVWRRKQYYTQQLIDSIEFDGRLINLLKKLKQNDYLIYCASNSIYNTVKMMLIRKGIMEYFDYFISNEDVKHPKPNPEIYLKCFQRANISPMETLILEDSPIGRKAAQLSGAHLCPIQDPRDVSLHKIQTYINMAENNNAVVDTQWKKPINVVIPMAGLGSRFSSAGYTFPKPLIDVAGKPMIQVVIENLNIDGNFIFILQKEHNLKYNLETFLRLIKPNCKIVEIDGLTEGAACTVLKAKELINNDLPLLLANSDQFLEWDCNQFLYSMDNQNIDGGISTFISTHPRWSYAKLNQDGYVSEVAEKVPISDHATTGIYYWKHGKDFVKYAEMMIDKNIRTNNEFYVCPVFNQAIGDNKKIIIQDCEKMWGLGIPEDLQHFLQNYKSV